MKALVLAGGKGTRLKPITNTLPKQLIPVANKPVIHFVLEHIQEAGIDKVGVIVSPDTSSTIIKSLKSKPWNLDLEFITQDKPLGLAHAVIMAKEFLADESFVMYLGDNLLGQNLSQLIKKFQGSNVSATVLLKKVDNPSQFGVAIVDEYGKVTRLVEKPPNHISDLALVGTYCFSKDIHSAIEKISPSDRGELEITDAIQQLVTDNCLVVGHLMSEWWLDCGTPGDLIKANKEILNTIKHEVGKSNVELETTLSTPIMLGDYSRVTSSDLVGPMVVGRRTTIINSTIGPNTSIGDDCIISNSKIRDSVIMSESTIKDINGIANSVIGPRASITRLACQTGESKFLVGEDTEVDI